MSMPIFKVDAEILHTCSTCSSRGLTSFFFFFFSCVLFAENLVEGGPHLPKFVNNKNKRQVRSSQWHIKDVCKISRFESKKRREHSSGNTFGLFYVNQPVNSILSDAWLADVRFDKTLDLPAGVSFKCACIPAYLAYNPGGTRHRIAECKHCTGGVRSLMIYRWSMTFRADRSLVHMMCISYCNDLCISGQTYPWSTWPAWAIAMFFFLAGQTNPWSKWSARTIAMICAVQGRQIPDLYDMYGLYQWSVPFRADISLVCTVYRAYRSCCRVRVGRS